MSSTLPPLSTSSSSSTPSMRSFSSLYAIKPRLSVRIFSASSNRRRRHHHSHWGFYKLFSSSDPTLYTSTTTTTSPTSSSRPSSTPVVRSRSHSYCERIPSMKELTCKCTTAAAAAAAATTTTNKPTTVMSIRAMELEALIDNYPHYTLHLTLTPRLCLEV